MARESTPLHKLYAEHHGWLIGWLRRRLGNTDQAADLAQDTFVKLVVNPEPQAIEQPRAYLATIARRLLIDQARRQTLEQAYLETMTAQPVHHAPSEEARALVLESLRHIDAILEKLAPAVRSVFLLSQLDDLTYEEIAMQLSISTRTVKRYMATAFEECLCAIAEAA